MSISLVSDLIDPYTDRHRHRHRHRHRYVGAEKQKETTAEAEEEVLILRRRSCFLRIASYHTKKPYCCFTAALLLPYCTHT